VHGFWRKHPIAQCAAVSSNCQRERNCDQCRRDRKCAPHTSGNGVGMRHCDVGRRRCEREHGAHDGCAGDEPEIARQAEHAGNDAPPIRRIAGCADAYEMFAPSNSQVHRRRDELPQAERMK